MQRTRAERERVCGRALLCAVCVRRGGKGVVIGFRKTTHTQSVQIHGLRVFKQPDGDGALTAAAVGGSSLTVTA